MQNAAQGTVMLKQLGRRFGANALGWSSGGGGDYGGTGRSDSKGSSCGNCSTSALALMLMMLVPMVVMILVGSNGGKCCWFQR